jgi:hypothetical protein
MSPWQQLHMRCAEGLHWVTFAPYGLVARSEMTQESCLLSTSAL